MLFLIYISYATPLELEFDDDFEIQSPRTKLGPLNNHRPRTRHHTNQSKMQTAAPSPVKKISIATQQATLPPNTPGRRSFLTSSLPSCAQTQKKAYIPNQGQKQYPPIHAL